MLSADILREARLRAGLTQTELARRADTTQSAIGRWERGRVQPGLETLRRLVRACGLELTFELATYDDSYVPQIERALRLTPAERVADAARRAERLRELREPIVAARRG